MINSKLFAAVAVALIACTALVSGQPDEQRVLSMPVSPGSIAMLAEFPASAAAEAKLAEALGSPQSEIRAAAARVAFITGRLALVGQVIALLERETDLDVVFEASRAVAYLGSAEHNGALLAAWERVRVHHIPLILAAARGLDVLELLPRMRQGGISTELLGDVLRTATRDAPQELARVAERAIREGDRVLVMAALQASDEAGVTPPPQVIVEAFNASPESHIGWEAMRHLLRTWRPVSPSFAPTIAERVSAHIAALPSDLSAEEIFLYELAARALQRPSRNDAAWTQLLRTPHTDIVQHLDMGSAKILLTEQERAVLSATYALDPRLWVTNVPTAEARTTPLTAGPPTVTASGYPEGLMASVFAVTKCRPSTSKNLEVDAGASEVTIRRGRLSHIAPIAMPTPKSCDSAIRTLLLNYTPEVDTGLRDGETALLMVPMTTSFVRCQDGARTLKSRPPARPLTGINMMPTPKKTGGPNPQYPESVRSQRISGAVAVELLVSATGCVQNSKVLRSVHPALDWASIRTLLDWRFEAPRLDGAPTFVTITVEVNYVLK